MQKFIAPTCKTHPQFPVTHICFDSKVKYICESCLTSKQYCGNHLKKVMDIPAFAKNVEETSTQLEVMENKAIDRHAELCQIVDKCKTNYNADEEDTIKNMMKVLENENKEYRELCKSVKNKKSKLGAAYSLVSYFQHFHDSQLFQMKINLSSPKGLKIFLKKAETHSTLLNKKVQIEYKKIESEVLQEEKKIKDFEENSLALRLWNSVKPSGRVEEQRGPKMKVINIPIKNDI